MDITPKKLIAKKIESPLNENDVVFMINREGLKSIHVVDYCSITSDGFFFGDLSGDEYFLEEEKQDFKIWKLFNLNDLKLK